MTYQKFTVETTVAAPVKVVWEAYTPPGDITQWNFANDDWCCPYAVVDLRAGGEQTARMEAKDGSMAFDFEGTFEEVQTLAALTLVVDDGRTPARPSPPRRRTRSRCSAMAGRRS